MKIFVNTVFWIWLLVVCECCMCYSEASATDFHACTANNSSQTRFVIDMVGRKVAVPCKINRIATIGPVPVINSYVFALGEGNKIVNGLPSNFTRTKRWRLQTAIAPHLADQVVLQGQMGHEANIEALMSLRPDIVITMDAFMIKALENTGIPVICLQWTDDSDIKANMKVLGEVLDRTPRSNEYLRYFETKIAGVHQTLKGISTASIPKVLYLNAITLTTPLLIAEWWIREAGGQSVTAKITRSGTVNYSHEQVMQWNPDIMIVSTPEQIAKVYQDKRFSMVNAVQNRKVYAIPVGVHSWGERNIEQPLTVLWAAKLFHPELFRNTDLVKETQNFYREFFGYNLTNKEAIEIINGGSSN